jgi:hypothetical protein
MPTERRLADVVAFASLAHNLYQPGQPLRDVIDMLAEEPDGDREGNLALDFLIESQGHELRNLVAVADALELALEASTIAVLSDEAIEGLVSPEDLRRMAAEPLVTLDITALADGSFMGRVKAVFTRTRSRRAIIATAVLTTAVINIMFPPLVVPTLVVAGVGAVSEIAATIQEHRAAARDAREKAAMQRRIEELEQQEAERAQREAFMNRRIDHLERQIAEFQPELSELRRDRVDAESVEAAGGTQLTVIIGNAA